MTHKTKLFFFLQFLTIHCELRQHFVVFPTDKYPLDACGTKKFSARNQLKRKKNAWAAKEWFRE